MVFALFECSENANPAAALQQIPEAIRNVQHHLINLDVPLAEFLRLCRFAKLADCLNECALRLLHLN